MLYFKTKFIVTFYIFKLIMKFILKTLLFGWSAMTGVEIIVLIVSLIQFLGLAKMFLKIDLIKNK